MSNVRMQLSALVLALGVTGAAHAVPTVPVANFAQVQPKKGTPAKIVLYKNQDVTKTTTTIIKTPVYGPVYDKQGHVIGTKVVSYASKAVKSTVITPHSQLLSTDGKSTGLSTPIVSFQFLAKLPAAYQAQLSGIQNAYFLLDAVSTSAPVVGGGFAVQNFDSGIIKFTRTTPIQFYSPTGQAIGGPKSNLLTITFGNAVYAGQVGGTSTALTATSQNSVINFSSDFLNFANATDMDFSIALNAALAPIAFAAINPSLTNVTGHTSLVTDRSNVVGTFGASSVPEPAAWSMMIAGFGIVGWRRRARRGATLSMAA